MNDDFVARIGQGVGDFDADAWNACAGDANPFVSHGFLSALEDSGSVGAAAGWQPVPIAVDGDDGRLAGVVTDGDLRRHLDGLLERTAGEVMTPGPKKTAPPTMLASEALALMSDPAPPVTVLFVVEDGRPVGILHIHDLLRAGVM